MKLGIALGGGGARGFAHLGVLKVLRQAGIEFDVVAGTSVGALVGVVYASGGTEELEKYAQRVNRAEIAVRLGPGWPNMGIFSGKYIEELVHEFVPERNIEELRKPFCALTVDLKTAEIITFTKGDLSTAVRASVSIPGLFKPVFYEDKILVDGGILMSVPVKAAKDLGADAVFAVDLLEDISNSKHQLEGTWSLGEIIQRTSIMAQRQINHFRYVKDPPDILITPKVSHVRVMDYHKGREVMECGIRAAEKALPDILSFLDEAK